MELHRVSASAALVEPTSDIGAVGRFVAQLDGANYDQLYIECVGPSAADSRRMTLSGGANGVVVFSIVLPDDDTYCLCNGTGGSEEYATISSGGQVIEILARWRVPVDRAARALYYFLLTETLDPALPWDRLSSIAFQPGGE